jgi:hypothetical protein
MSHPEELLAVYVGGSLEPAEREAVEAHLATCAACRVEVEYAAAARAVLRELPELEAPGLAAGGLAGLGGDLAERRATRAARDRSDRWMRVAWSGGLAAAAVVAVVFIFAGGLFRGGGEDAATGPNAGAPAAESQIAIVQGGDRTRESLDALARSLAQSTDRSATLSGQPGAATPVPSPEGPVAADAVVEEVVACVREGAALGAEVAPTYLEESTFEGAPVYVGAFVVPAEEGSGSHLELVAVTRDDCQPVYFARQNL